MYTYTHIHIPVTQGSSDAIEDHHAEGARVVGLDAVLDVPNRERPKVREELLWVLYMYVCMYLCIYICAGLRGTALGPVHVSMYVYTCDFVCMYVCAHAHMCPQPACHIMMRVCDLYKIFEWL